MILHQNSIKLLKHAGITLFDIFVKPNYIEIYNLCILVRIVNIHCKLTVTEYPRSGKEQENVNRNIIIKENDIFVSLQY